MVLFVHRIILRLTRRKVSDMGTIVTSLFLLYWISTNTTFKRALCFTMTINRHYKLYSQPALQPLETVRPNMDYIESGRRLLSKLRPSITCKWIVGHQLSTNLATPFQSIADPSVRAYSKSPHKNPSNGP